MDPNPALPGEVTNLLDHEAKLVADAIQHFRAVALAATVRVSNRSTVGEAAANRLRMETEAAGLIKTAEDMLTLTRRIRELWVIGPLRKPGEGDAEAETRIRDAVVPVAGLLDGQRAQARQRLLGPHGTYRLTATGGPPPPAPPSTAAPATGAPSAPAPSAVTTAAATTGTATATAPTGPEGGVQPPLGSTTAAQTIAGGAEAGPGVAATAGGGTNTGTNATATAQLNQT
ncbi:metacaspase [Niveomyces insectorum RCEF 264]|uniref:Metacaspase n=1 Tax=Niveomyces insectorum RCEF 264 TaxID=1081102 RepID=A0A167P2W1_9HYPO|nr:metacaspase [Niveomyces insectorum RCEF 264]